MYVKICNLCKNEIKDQETQIFLKIQITSPTNKDGFFKRNLDTDLHICNKCYKEKLEENLIGGYNG